MVKAVVVIYPEQDNQFLSRMSDLFSLFRGEKRIEIRLPSFTAYFQFDEVVNDGFVWETDEYFFAELGINYSSASVEEKIAACQSMDEKDLRRTIDGEVVQIFLDKKLHEVRIVTEWFGTLPVYFHSSASGTVFSTDLKGVLSVFPSLRDNLDERSITEYLACHFMMENRTLFENVHLLPEGSIIQLKTDDHSKWIQKEWFSLPNEFQCRPIEHWIQQVALQFRKAVKKRAKENYGSFISGGMDSRLIVAAIPDEVKRSIKLLTFGVEGAIDCKYAKKVAKRLNFDILHDIIPLEAIWKNAFEHLWISDGASNHTISFILESVRKLGAPAIFDGTPGDANLGGGYSTSVDELSDGVWPENKGNYVFNWLVKKGIARNLEHLIVLMGTSSSVTIRNDIEQAIEREIARLPEDMNPLLQFENTIYRLRVKRNTMGGQYAVDSIALSLKPYMDADFFELVMQIPANERSSHTFFNKILRQAFPEILRDPTTRVLPFLRYTNLVRKIKHYVNAVGRRLGIIVFKSMTFLPVTNMMRSNQAYMEWITKILLDSRTISRGIISREGVISLMKRHMSGDVNVSTLLVNAIDLEIVLRLFCDGDGFVDFAKP